MWCKSSIFDKCWLRKVCFGKKLFFLQKRRPVRSCNNIGAFDTPWLVILKWRHHSVCLRIVTHISTSFIIRGNQSAVNLWDHCFFLLTWWGLPGISADNKETALKSERKMRENNKETKARILEKQEENFPSTFEQLGNPTVTNRSRNRAKLETSALFLCLCLHSIGTFNF